MEEEQIVDFETAKLAKEKGFDWRAFEYYSEDNRKSTLEIYPINHNKYEYNRSKT